MEEEGVHFRKGVVPTKLEKLDSGKIKVTFSDGETDEYDTVLAAVGRTGDTAKLGLENAGVAINPKNGKITATHEQSSVPNVYAVGDVMDGCPELTPVAVQAGKALSRRRPASANDLRSAFRWRRWCPATSESRLSCLQAGIPFDAAHDGCCCCCCCCSYV